MTVEDVGRIIESWAPRWIAWEKDNVGLQVGDPTRKVKRILVALDVTHEVVKEAEAEEADLIVSHHPLLFRPPSTITTSDEIGKLVLRLAEKKIAVYAAHTNLDFAKEGVSFQLARKLGLENVRFLLPLKGLLSKIVVFVPERHADAVAEAMAHAGGGIIGEYELCSFQTEGTGAFRGSARTKPAVGKAGKFEKVSEIKLEMVAPRARVNAIVEAMKSAHPYEEAACDLYDVENPSPNHGSGAVGELSNEMTLGQFLKNAKTAMQAESLRVVGNVKEKVKRIAVCGGSGSDLLPVAIKAKADVFVTADVRYHTFHAARGKIALIDAGHWETEHVILEPLQQRIQSALKRGEDRIDVFVTKHSTNPIHNF